MKLFYNKRIVHLQLYEKKFINSKTLNISQTVIQRKNRTKIWFNKLTIMIYIYINYIWYDTY